MQSRKYLAIVLLGLSVTAAADFRTITEVYEIDFDKLRLPGIAGGTLAIRQCEDCETQVLRVSTRARYVLNNRSLTLAKFKTALSSVPNRDDVVVGVHHHLDSNTITAVKVRL